MYILKTYFCFKKLIKENNESIICHHNVRKRKARLHGFLYQRYGKPTDVSWLSVGSIGFRAFLSMARGGLYQSWDAQQAR